LYIRKVLFISRLALVLVLSFVVVKTVLLPKDIEANLAPASAMGRNRVRGNETITPPDFSLPDYAQIVERNPFGTSGKRGPMANLIAFDHSVSKELGLALLGTVSGNPAVARAIIKDLKTGVLDLYRMGQTVASARIESIDKDAVILLHNEQRKILRLNTAQSQAPSSRTINKNSYPVRTDLPTRGTDTDLQAEIGPVEAILKQAVIEPYVAEGQIEGLRITGLENIKAAKDLGLKNGDVIRVVNGHRLTNKQQAYQVLKKARSQPAINLELLRGNETKKLSFALR